MVTGASWIRGRSAKRAGTRAVRGWSCTDRIVVASWARCMCRRPRVESYRTRKSSAGPPREGPKRSWPEPTTGGWPAKFLGDFLATGLSLWLARAQASSVHTVKNLENSFLLTSRKRRPQNHTVMFSQEGPKEKTRGKGIRTFYGWEEDAVPLGLVIANGTSRAVSPVWNLDGTRSLTIALLP